MSNKIKGITLEIGGDTAGLTKALSKVNKETGTIQRELKEVEKALKLDPNNTELLAQKQLLLADSIAVTEKKVEALRKAKEKADKEIAEGTEVNQEQYRKLQREIVKTENALEDAKKQAEETGEALNKAGDGKKTEKNLSALKGTLGTVTKGALGFGAAVVGVAAGLSELEESTREYREDLNKLHTAFTSAGKSVQSADKIYKDFFGILGESDRAIEAANHLALLTNNEQELAQWTKIAAGVNATFTDSLPIEGLTEAANETAKVGQVTGVLADALNWAGISEDEFNAKLEKLNSEQERSALITQTLSDTYSNIGTKYMETNEAVIANREAQLKWNDEMARFGEVIAPAKAAVVEFGADALGGLTNWITDANSETAQLLKNTKSLSENYKNSATAIEEQTAKELSEIETIRILYSELESLVDETGEINEENRARADFIAGELSNALGTEISLTGNAKKTLDSLRISVEEYVKQRQIQILLEAQEDKFIEASENRKKAIDAEAEAYAKMIELEAKYKMPDNLSDEEKWSFARDNMSGDDASAYAEVVQAYKEAAEAVSGYTQDIQNYYDATTAAAEGNVEKLKTIVDSEGIIRAESAEMANKTEEEKRAVMKTQFDKALVEYQLALERYKNEPNQANAEMVKAASAHALEVGAEYEKVGGNINAGLKKGLEDTKKGVFSAVSSIISSIKNLFTSKDGLDEHSPSKWAEGVAEFVDEGLAKGFINKAGVVTDAAGNVVEGVKKVVVAGNEELLEEEKKYLEEKQRIEDEDAAKQKKTAEQIQKEKNKVYLDGLKEAADIAKKERKQVQDYFDDMISDVQKNIANAEKEMTSFRNKLAEIDELAVVPTTTFTGLFGGDDLVVEGTPKLADLSGRIAELTKYHDNLTTLKDMGVDDSLLEEIKGRGEEEGGLFMEAFLNSTDEERDLFLRQYEEIGKLSGKTAGEMFQTEIEEATKGISDVFAEMNPDMLKVGEDWGTVLGEGITTKIKEALETIKGMVGMTDYTPNAGVVYQTQITQHITSTPQTAYESAEQTRRVMENLDSQAVLS